MASTVGDKVAARRQELGLSRFRLAVLAGVNPGTVENVEKGWKTPTVRTIQALAKALDVPVTDLLPEEAA